MPSPDRREAADLIVVGAGVGGLAAAILAGDRGRRVVLVERTRELGGGAAFAAEPMIAAGTRFQRAAGVDDAPERLVEDLLGEAGDPAAEAAARAIAAHSAATVEWLADRCGVAITLHETASGTRRLHGCGPQGGAELVAGLGRVVARHHRIRTRLGQEVGELLRGESGAISGVTLRAERRAATAIDGPVLLACGGFAADDALVGMHAPQGAAVPWVGPPLCTGDGLRLGMAAGAAAAHLDVVDVTPLLAQPGHIEVPRALLGRGAILVNQAGRRFADETGAPVDLARAIGSQPGRVAYLVFDDRIAAAAGTGRPWLEHVVLPRTRRRGATATDLAKQFEIDTETFTATIDQVPAGPEAHGARPDHRLAPPLQAIRVTASRRRTRGGLCVDAAARVVDRDGVPIARLWATGGAADSLDAAQAAPVEGLETLAALVRGRLAVLDLLARSAPEHGGGA